MDDETTTPGIIHESLGKAISERYLQYALSTIMHRALPDARDGLKPVHRRILHAMRELKLGSSGGFRKSAKISGDVMGNYHPHGDQAIYDALVRLAQSFNMRYPLVEGQGNFGNIDGDNAAASRYTEARLHKAAEALMEGMAENAVEFRPNYDGTLEEPVVLPAVFPNLLANGSSGIAVGMATNIPPHNIGELCDACLRLLKAPDARDDTLAGIVKGPDFPTGGIIVDPPEVLADAYRTGKGSIRVRASWDVEKLERGTWQIIVTEIPFQVPKSRLIERIASLIQDKKLQSLADVRDESAEDIRIVLEPRSRNIDDRVLMEALFKQTDLEKRFALNMNVLIDGRTPKVCSLKEVLKAFLDHRREVLIRRSRHRLGKIDQRLEILEGLIIAFLNLDKVIEIIRFHDHPKTSLMEEFSISDNQAEAILNMRLRSLHKLEEIELKTEQDKLMAERVEVDDLLNDEALQWSRIAEEIRDVRKRFGADAPGGARRTRFEDPPQLADLPADVMVEKEPITVVCSRMGWIRSMKGTLPVDQEFKYRDGDEGRFVLHADTTDKLLLFGSNGRFYTIAASAIPGGRGMGEPVRVMVDLPNDADIVNLLIHDGVRKLVLASAQGSGFIVNESEVVASTRNGKQIMNVRAPDFAKVCAVLEGDHIAVTGEIGRLLIFPVSELAEMVRGKGVRLQKYAKGGLADIKSFNLSDGLKWKERGGRTRTVTDLEPWIGRRAAVGSKPPRGFPKDYRFT